MTPPPSPARGTGGAARSTPQDRPRRQGKKAAVPAREHSAAATAPDGGDQRVVQTASGWPQWVLELDAVERERLAEEVKMTEQEAELLEAAAAAWVPRLAAEHKSPREPSPVRRAKTGYQMPTSSPSRPARGGRNTPSPVHSPERPVPGGQFRVPTPKSSPDRPATAVSLSFSTDVDLVPGGEFRLRPTPSPGSPSRVSQFLARGYRNNAPPTLSWDSPGTPPRDTHIPWGSSSRPAAESSLVPWGTPSRACHTAAALPGAHAETTPWAECQPTPAWQDVHAAAAADIVDLDLNLTLDDADSYDMEEVEGHTVAQVTPTRPARRGLGTPPQSPARRQDARGAGTAGKPGAPHNSWPSQQVTILPNDSTVNDLFASPARPGTRSTAISPKQTAPSQSAAGDAWRARRKLVFRNELQGGGDAGGASTSSTGSKGGKYPGSGYTTSKYPDGATHTARPLLKPDLLAVAPARSGAWASSSDSSDADGEASSSSSSGGSTKGADKQTVSNKTATFLLREARSIRSAVDNLLRRCTAPKKDGTAALLSEPVETWGGSPTDYSVYLDV